MRERPAHALPSRSGEEAGPIFGLTTDPDIAPGHEAAGVVAKVGESVTAFKPGDRVAVHHIGGCGDCIDCRRGFDMKCQHKWGIYGLDQPGALQDYMVVRSRDCVAVPANIDFDEAAYYTCGAGTGYLALRRASFGLGDSVAVVGLGPVGMAAAYFALRSGALVVALDTVASRRAFAREIGLSLVFDPGDHTALEQVRVATGGRGATVVVEASGSSAGRLVALGAAAIGGRVVMVGFGDADNLVDIQATVIQKQLDVLGAWMFPIPDLQEMLLDVSLRGISIKPLITGNYNIDDAAKAWAGSTREARAKPWLPGTAPSPPAAPAMAAPANRRGGLKTAAGCAALLVDGSWSTAYWSTASRRARSSATSRSNG